MSRRFLRAAAVVVVLVSGASAALPAAAGTNDQARGHHKLLVVVKTSQAPAAAKHLALLVLLTQNGGAPAGAVVTPGRPLSVLLANSGLYRVRAVVNSSCKGRCSATYRVSGATNHELAIVPTCRPSGSSLLCSALKIVKVY